MARRLEEILEELARVREANDRKIQAAGLGAPKYELSMPTHRWDGSRIDYETEAPAYAPTYSRPTVSGPTFDTPTFDTAEDLQKKIEEDRARDEWLRANTFDMDLNQAAEMAYQAEMKPEEVKAYNQLYNTQGRDAAEKYYSDVREELQKRANDTNKEFWIKMGEEHPLFTDVLSMGNDIVAKPGELLQQLGQKITKGKIDENDLMNNISTNATAYGVEGVNRWGEKNAGRLLYEPLIRQDLMSRGASEDYINEQLNSEETANLYDSAGKVFREYHPVAREVAKNALLGLAIQQNMLASGLAPEAAKRATEAVSLSIMGTGAAADSISQAKAEGKDDATAISLGLIAGGAEVISELLSMEALLNPEASLTKGQIARYLIKNLGAEGSEEVVSDILNDLASLGIEKDKSEIMQKVRALQESEGISEAEAFGRVIFDRAKNEYLQSFKGGAVAGFISALLGVGVHSYNSSRMVENFGINTPEAVQNLIDSGLESDESSESYELAKRLQDRMDQGKTPSDLELSGLLQANQEAMAAERKALSDQISELMPSHDKETVSTMAALYEPEQGLSVDEYVQGSNDYFLAGVNGEDINDVVSENGEKLTDVQKQEMYTLGKESKNEGLHLRKGSERNDSESTGTGFQQLEEDTGRNQTREAQSRNIADSEAASLNVGELVSPREIGIPGGSSEKSIYLVEGGDTKYTAPAREKATSIGYDIKFVKGTIPLSDGTRVRGIVDFDNKTIYVQADHPVFNAEQIANHELMHERIRSGQVDMSATKAAIVKQLGVKQFGQMINDYASAYAGTLSMSDEAAIEEIICDAAGGMNIFSKANKAMEETFAPALETVKASTKYNETNQANAPPAAASREAKLSAEPNTDSLGNKLTKEQAEYFEDSKVRDENGNLLVVYHGTESEFNEFKPSKFLTEKNGLSRIVGYFSEDEEYSKNYGDTKPYYLNITNPLVLDGNEKTLKEWNKFFKSNGVTKIEYDSSVSGKNYNRDPLKGGDFPEGIRYTYSELLDDYGYWWGDGNLTERIEAAGYDGIQTNDEIEKAWMAFDSSQVKSVDNKKPSSSKDTRYSREAENMLNDVSTQEGDIRKFSMETYDKGGKAALAEYLSKYSDLSKKDQKEILSSLEWGYSVAKEMANNKDLTAFGNWSKTGLVKAPDGTPLLEMTGLSGAPLRSVIVTNGEYPLNIDFTTVCKKRMALDAVLNRLTADAKINLGEMSEADLAGINRIIREHGFEIACGLCYVDAKRYKVGKYANTFVNGEDKDGAHTYGWNELVNSMLKKGASASYFELPSNHEVPLGTLLSDLDDKDINFKLIDEIIKPYLKKDGTIGQAVIDGETSNPTEEVKRAYLLKTDPTSRHLLDKNDIIASEGLDELKLLNPDLWKLVTTHGAQAAPKASMGFTAYGNDIIKAKAFTKENAYKVGGVRVQSFSDYVANMFFDYMQMFADMSARELPSHAFTKEPNYVKLFGMTGQRINMSLIFKGAELTAEQAKRLAKLKTRKAVLADPEFGKLAEHAGLDEKGNYIYETESFPHEVAYELRKDPRYKNCGTIAVGLSDAHIRKLLADPQIDMVIPYHASGVSPLIKNARNLVLYTDYSKFQNTRNKQGKALKKGDFEWYGNLQSGIQKGVDAKANADAYLKWCDKNGYTPKFEQFRDEENYYKLLEDFRSYDNEGNFMPQDKVTMTFPDNFKDIVAESLKEHQESYYGRLDSELSDDQNSLYSDVKEFLKEKGVAKYSAEPTMDTEGNKLTKAQSEYFKDSKVRDENGNLKVMYHGTRFGGFTIFDPEYSDDKRSLFFSDNRDVARSYTLAIGGEPVNDYQEGDKGTMVYPVYLNVTNPLTVDAKGKSWARIQNGAVKKYNAERNNIWDYIFLSKEDLDNFDKETGVVELYNAYKEALENGTAEYNGEELYEDDLLDKLYDLNHEYARYFINHRQTISAKEFFDNPSDYGWWDLYSLQQEYDDDGASLSEIKDFSGDDYLTAVKNMKDYFDEEIEFGYIENDFLDNFYFGVMPKTGEEVTQLDLHNTRWFAEKAQEEGYDGVIFKNLDDSIGTGKESTVVVAFDSNQVKLTNNENPSVNKDIRYSTESETIARLRKENAKLERDLVKLQEAVNKWRDETRITKNLMVNTLDARAIAESLLKRYPSQMSKIEATRRIAAIGDYVLNASRDSLLSPEKYISDIKTMALDLASDIVNKSDIVKSENSYENDRYNISDVVENLANEIVEESAFGQMQSKQSMGDKLSRMISERNALEKRVRSTQESLDRLKIKREDDIQKLKDEYKAKKQSEKDKREAKVLRDKIAKHSKALSDKLLKPTDTKHITEYKNGRRVADEQLESLKSVTAKVLSLINQESAYTVKEDGKHAKPGEYGLPTKKTEAWRRLLREYNNLAEDGGYLTDEALRGTDGWIADIVDFADKPINTLGVEELSKIYNCLRSLEKTIENANKMFSISRNISDLAFGLIDDNENRTPKSSWQWKTIDNIALGMLTPEAYFHEMGQNGEQLFRILRDAQDQYILNIDKVKNFYENNIDVDTGKLKKEMHTVRLGNQDVEISTAALMELYVLARRKQALDHILTGGIKIRNEVAKKGKIEQRVKPITKITEDQLRNAFTKLTQEQIQIADKLQGFLSEDMSKLGNEASMKVFGYEKFLEDNYWPIKVNKNHIQGRDAGAEDILASTVANKGMTKTVKPNAKNSINVGNIFDSFMNHAVEMSEYAAYLAAMEDVNRIRNFAYKDSTGDTVAMSDTVNTIHGEQGASYWQKLMSDLANGVHSDNAYFGGMMGKFKSSAVGANARVVVQQPTAIARAASMIDAKYLAQGMSHPFEGSKKAIQYAPIAKWKSWGYFDINTGRSLHDLIIGADTKLAKLNELLMAPAGKADDFAWGILWNAVEAETKAETDLEVGSDEYYEHCAKRFTEIIDRTQVVDGVLQRSQIMRSADGLTKMATSFMGEPIKQYNQLRSAWKDMRTNPTKATKQMFAKTLLSMGVAGVLNAAVKSVVDAIRHSDKDKDPLEAWWDEMKGVTGDEKNAYEVIKNFLGGNIGDVVNVPQYIPYLKDIESLTLGYDIDRMDMSVIKDVITSADKFMRSIGGSKETFGYALVNFASNIGKLFGVPATNIIRDFKALGTTGINALDNPLVEYNYQKLFSNPANNKKPFIDIMYDAWKRGDEETFNYIYKDLANNGVSEDSMQTNFDNHLKEEQYGKKEGVSVDDLKGRYVFKLGKTQDGKNVDKIEGFGSYMDYELNKAEEKKAKEEEKVAKAEMTNSIYEGQTYKEIESSSLWSKATTAQQNEIDNKLMQLAEGSNESLQNQVDWARTHYNVSESKWLLYTLARQIVNEQTNNGKGYNKEDKTKAAQMVGLTYAQVNDIEHATSNMKKNKK